MIKKFFYQKTKTSTIIFMKNDLLNVVLSERSDIKIFKFGDFWTLSKFRTSIANYEIYFEFFYINKNQNLGHLRSLKVKINYFWNQKNFKFFFLKLSVFTSIKWKKIYKNLNLAKRLIDFSTRSCHIFLLGLWET